MINNFHIKIKFNDYLKYLYLFALALSDTIRDSRTTSSFLQIIISCVQNDHTVYSDPLFMIEDID